MNAEEEEEIMRDEGEEMRGNVEREPKQPPSLTLQKREILSSLKNTWPRGLKLTIPMKGEDRQLAWPH